MAQRMCLGVDGARCNRLTSNSRCPSCARVVEARQDAAKRDIRPERSWAERQRRAAVVAAHRAQHGDWCPGWEREPHPVTDLTADHVVSVNRGGTEDGPLQVLCRSCNSAKG